MAHLDLRLGRVRHIPLHLEHELTPAVAAALSQAEKAEAFVPIEGVPFCVHAQFHRACDGNFAFWVDADRPLASGKIGPRSVLLAATVAGCEGSAPLAWRYIFQQWLTHMMECPFERNFGAPGTMPRFFPALWTLPTADLRVLSKDEWTDLLTVVRLVGLNLVERGRRGLQETAAKGYSLAPDPDQYIELRDW